jgi:hypothetical protein
MRQAFHIFKKDVRHLWFEIAVAITVVAAFAFVGARRALWLVNPETNRTAAWVLVLALLPLAWWTLIARVIHDETLPGDRQFWISRPYSWKSLLAAKVLFILVFINVPMLFADAVIVRAYGLHPFSAQLPGLLWSEVLLAVVFVLPIAALSAVTAGFVQLIFAVLTPCVVGLGLAIVAPEAVLGGLLGPFEWVRTYYVFLLIAVGASAILVWQYSRRRTAAARGLAVAVAILAIAGMGSIPWPATFRIQSWFSPQKVDSSSVHVDFDSGEQAHALMEQGDRARIIIPLNVTGLPNEVMVQPEGFAVRIRESDGAVSSAERILPVSAAMIGREFDLQTDVDGRFYRRLKNEPLTIKGSLYLTLFGHPQTERVPFGDRSVPVPRIGLCSASRSPNGRPYFLVCTSAFRFPLARVSYRFVGSGQGTTQTVWSDTSPRPVSYSPFPATLGIDPVSQDVTYSITDAPVSEAMVDTVEPLAHIRRSFEADNVRLVSQ